jgi:transposase-like protein
VAVYVALAVDLTGHKAALGHWVGDGAEGANFWLSVLNDLQARGVQDIFIACVDGWSGFKEAIQAVFPKTLIQRCLVHQPQVRHMDRSQGIHPGFESHLPRPPFAVPIKKPSDSK